MKKKILCLFLIFVMVFSCVSNAHADNTYVNKAAYTPVSNSKTNIIAHRGFSSQYPENTMLAFEEAIAAGFDGFECDIYENTKKEFMVMHNSTIKSLCGKSGVYIWDVNTGNRASYPVTKGANNDLFDETLLIPTLQEVLRLVSQSNCKLYLEIKNPTKTLGEDGAPLRSSVSADAAKRIVNMIMQYHVEENVYIFAKNYHDMKLFLGNGIKVGLCTKNPTEKTVKTLADLKADFVSVYPPSSFDGVDIKAFIDMCHEYGLLVCDGLASTVEEWNRDKRVQFDFVISNYQLDAEAKSKIKQMSMVPSKIEARASKLKVIWNPVKGARSYTIYRSCDGGKWEKVAYFPYFDATSWSDEKCKHLKKYTYRIIVQNSLGKSLGGNEKSLVYVKRPSLKVTKKSTGDLKVEWSKVSSVSGYQVQYATKEADVFDAPIKSYSSSTYSATYSLTARKRYYARVRSYKIIKGVKYYSGWSSIKNVKI